MTVRVTASDVRTILETDLEDTSIARFIVVANNQVDALLVPKGLSDALLTDIELFLSAHFATMMDPRAFQEKVGDFFITYEGKTGTGLKGSRYGQTAIDLDTSGTLIGLGKKKIKMSAIPETWTGFTNT